MSSEVRLAPWMPATRLTAKASPLGRFARRTRVWAESSTRHDASATRRVTGFPDTSTMWALPCGSRWLNDPCDVMEFLRRDGPLGAASSPAPGNPCGLAALRGPCHPANPGLAGRMLASPGPSKALRVAIVVPTLNEEATIPSPLPAALAALGPPAAGGGLGGSDGGSVGPTGAIARALGARGVPRPP